jgi:predicted metal-dependent phosphoesterase TrpH
MVSPSQLVQAAAAAGVSVIAITDHDTFSGNSEAAEAGLAFGVGVVPGEEVTTSSPANVHVLGLFLNGPIRMGLPVRDTINAIHDRGGLAVIAHPWMPTYFASITPNALRRLIAEAPVDGIELRHTCPTTRSRIRALDDFYELHKDRLGAALGSSDSHFGGYDLGRTVTIFPGRTPSDLRQAIETAATIPLERYARPVGPPLSLRLRQQARSMGWLSWQRWRGRIGHEGA